MRIVWFLRVIIAVAFAAIHSTATAQIQLSPVATGLSSPVFAGHAGDGSDRLFIVEQRKVLRSRGSAPGACPSLLHRRIPLPDPDGWPRRSISRLLRDANSLVIPPVQIVTTRPDVVR